MTFADRSERQRRTLAPQQRRILRWLHLRRAAGEMPPTLRDLGIAFGWTSPNTPMNHMLRLRRKGMLCPTDGDCPDRAGLMPSGWLLVTAHESPTIVPMTDLEAAEMLARLVPGKEADRV